MKKYSTGQNLVILGILIFGIYATLQLVIKDFTQGDVCPKMLNIPVCYIILICFVMPFTTHIFKLNRIWYFSGTILAFSIALFGTISQIFGSVECPKTSGGTPMCYISLGIFSTLIILKLLSPKG